MRGRRSKIMGCLLAGILLLTAPVAMAQPVDGFGWLGWVESAWSSLLEAVGVTSAASGTEEEPEPEPAPAPAPLPNAPTTEECPTCGGGEQDGGPTLDPDG